MKLLELAELLDMGLQRDILHQQQSGDVKKLRRFSLFYKSSIHNLTKFNLFFYKI